MRRYCSGIAQHTRQWRVRVTRIVRVFVWWGVCRIQIPVFFLSFVASLNAHARRRGWQEKKNRQGHRRPVVPLVGLCMCVCRPHCAAVLREIGAWVASRYAPCAVSLSRGSWKRQKRKAGAYVRCSCSSASGTLQPGRSRPACGLDSQQRVHTTHGISAIWSVVRTSLCRHPPLWACTSGQNGPQRGLQ